MRTITKQSKWLVGIWVMISVMLIVSLAIIVYIQWQKGELKNGILGIFFAIAVLAVLAEPHLFHGYV